MNGIILFLFSINSDSSVVRVQYLFMRMEKLSNSDRFKLQINKWICLIPSGVFTDHVDSEMYYSEDQTHHLMGINFTQFANQANNIIQNPSTALWISISHSW